MSQDAFAKISFTDQTLQKSKPRYTEEENQLIYDSWWNPQKRRELAKILGRDMNALRSQFSRLLKEKGISNQDYYKMMASQSTHDNTVAFCKRNREIKTIDQLIFNTFCKHQALGNPRTKACEELLQRLGGSFTPAALKLRFYRMVNKFKYQDHDLLQIGKKLLTEANEANSNLPAGQDHDTLNNVTEISTAIKTEPFNVQIDNGQPGAQPVDTNFFYQISSLPEIVKRIEERLAKVEEQQRRQLDLRGFIEHLLAVERDLKREDKLLEEIQHLMDENEAMKNSMEKEKERLKKRETELNEVYQILETLLSDFMRLESVSKLASLGDFMHRLEITVDQFGNVMRSRRVG